MGLQFSNRLASVQIILVITVFALLISATSANSIASQVISGNNYSYQVPPPPDGLVYKYLWSASDGYSESYTDRVFIWRAPDVTAPKEVVIKVNVTDMDEGGCHGSNEIRLIVQPKGKISLEKKFDGDKDNVNLGDALTYVIKITNTGQTNVTYLPLIDDYPNHFLKAERSYYPQSFKSISL